MILFRLRYKPNFNYFELNITVQKIDLGNRQLIGIVHTNDSRVCPQICHSTNPTGVLTTVFYGHPLKQIVWKIPFRTVFIDTDYWIDSTRIALV